MPSLLPAVLATALAALASPAAACPDGVFVTSEDGAIAAVDWVEQSAATVHTRSVVTQSLVLDATVALNADQTAVRATATVSWPGGKPPTPRATTFAPGASYWSGNLASSIEQAVRRAAVVGRDHVELAVASPSSPWKGTVAIDRIDPTDWVLTAMGKRYQVLTDAQACLLAATLPAYGVTIERRDRFDPRAYQPWPPYGAPPDGAYSATEVRIAAPAGHVLAGTLTLPPRHRRRLPAVVLITGISPHERNNGQPPWMPFRDLADAYTRAGLAVLRVDDRGVGASTGERAPTTTYDEADDVHTEVEWLRARRDIDPARIALVGLSEGGLIAPIAAAKDRRIAAIVTLAGPGVSPTQLARYQIELAVNADPSIKPADRAREIEKELADLPTARDREFMKIDPLAWAAKVQCPALVVQGGSDRHVPPRSAEKLAYAMRGNGNADVTVRIFPILSHTLLPDPVGLAAQWVTLPAFFTSPQLLDVTTAWLRARLRP